MTKIERKAKSRIAAGVSRRRLAVTFFAFFAFFIQSYIVQTHVHIPAAAGTEWSGKLSAEAQKAAASLSQKGERGNYPADSDPSKCLLCQEFLASGSFVTPVAAAAFVPLAFVGFTIAAQKSSPEDIAPSHHWQSRAPPRA
ncbi:MAG TPA: hypothetical protein VGC27_06760 [Rhizomicrobium sp.]